MKFQGKHCFWNVGLGWFRGLAIILGQELNFLPHLKARKNLTTTFFFWPHVTLNRKWIIVYSIFTVTSSFPHFILPQSWTNPLVSHVWQDHMCLVVSAVHWSSIMFTLSEILTVNPKWLHHLMKWKNCTWIVHNLYTQCLIYLETLRSPI